MRAHYFGFKPIVCTSTHPSDDLIAAAAKEMKVDCFRGSLTNKLKRWSDCADFFELEAFHTLDCDDPFIDFNLARKSLRYLREQTLDVVKPSERSSQGAATVGYSFSSKFIKSIVNEIPESMDTEMVDGFLQSAAKPKIETIFEYLHSDNKMRLTVDYLEDWVLIYYLESIFSYSGERDKIDQYFEDNPNLHKINWFRNEEWKKRQNEAMLSTMKKPSDE
jgi:spore coat polysaccharide biosynthesis protein SpsF